MALLGESKLALTFRTLSLFPISSRKRQLALAGIIKHNQKWSHNDFNKQMCIKNAAGVCFCLCAQPACLAGPKVQKSFI